LDYSEEFRIIGINRNQDMGIRIIKIIGKILGKNIKFRGKF
jgi:hypothetical protein